MRKNAFANVAEREPKPVATPAPEAPASYPKHRQGKKALIAYFSPSVSKALRQMALDEDRTMQSLLGEAIDLLMRDRGKHPFGER
jgi:pyruvate/2-oxoglutarate dehydrogenase complex dihydrolipoamide acyltransferase (E2) component